MAGTWSSGCYRRSWDCTVERIRDLQIQGLAPRCCTVDTADSMWTCMPTPYTSLLSTTGNRACTRRLMSVNTPEESTQGTGSNQLMYIACMPLQRYSTLHYTESHTFQPSRNGHWRRLWDSFGIWSMPQCIEGSFPVCNLLKGMARIEGWLNPLCLHYSWLCRDMYSEGIRRHSHRPMSLPRVCLALQDTETLGCSLGSRLVHNLAPSVVAERRRCMRIRQR